MNPIDLAEFEYSGGSSHQRHRAALNVIIFYVIIAVLINIPAISLIRNWPVAASVAAQSELQSIKLPQPTIAPAVVQPIDNSGEANARLSKIITDFANTHAGKYAVTTINLDNPANTVTHNSDDNMLAASTYKMFAAYNALSKVEQGQWTMSTLTAFGTLDYCLQRAIVYSDNDCGEAIGAKLGWRTMTKFVQAAGFGQTSLDGSRGNLYSSANDEANLLAKLHGGKLLNAEHTKYLIDLMKRQVLRSGVPAGSNGSPVADKVGNLGTVNNDMAIVYSPKATYVLVIVTNGSSIASIRALSQQVYNFYNQ